MFVSIQLVILYEPSALSFDGLQNQAVLFSWFIYIFLIYIHNSIRSKFPSIQFYTIWWSLILLTLEPLIIWDIIFAIVKFTSLPSRLSLCSDKQIWHGHLYCSDTFSIFSLSWFLFTIESFMIPNITFFISINIL